MNVLMAPDYRVNTPYQTYLEKALKDNGVNVKFVSGYRRVLPITRSIFQHEDISVFHLHWPEPFIKTKNCVIRSIYWGKFILDVFLCKTVHKVSFVYTLHNEIPHDPTCIQLEVFFRKILYKQFDTIIAHGYIGKKILIEKYKCRETSIHVIPIGLFRLNGERIKKYDARSKLDISDEIFVFLYCGLVRPYKGVDRLIRAFISADISDSILFIVGRCDDEAYRNKLKDLIDGRLNVIWIDRYVSDIELAEYLTAADVSVYPFLRVQTSSSVALSMAYRLPVIAPRIGEIEETLGQATDLLYYPNVSSQLINKLKLSSTVDLDGIRKKIDASSKRLEWGNISKDLSSVYKQIANIC